MGNLVDLARWYSSPPSEEEYHRIVKVAGAVEEIGNVAEQVAGRLAIPVALALSTMAGIGSYKKTKAQFDPRVQAIRDSYYGEG